MRPGISLVLLDIALFLYGLSSDDTGSEGEANHPEAKRVNVSAYSTGGSSFQPPAVPVSDEPKRLPIRRRTVLISVCTSSGTTTGEITWLNLRHGSFSWVSRPRTSLALST